MIRVAAGVLFLVLAAGLAAPPDVTMDATVRAVLTRHYRFSPADLAEMQRGKAVRHGVDSRAPSEVAVAGGIRVNAPKTAFFARVRDITHFKSSPDILQIGLFSQPPKLEDLAPLVVDKDDFDVRDCRVGDCGIRLPADLIRRAQTEIDPNAPDLQARAAAWFKDVLLEDVTAYVTGGPGRFSQYDDGSEPIRPIAAFEAILHEDAAAIGMVAPGLPEHLEHFPEHHLADAEDFLYWSKEKFGPEAFITVTHVTIVCPSAATCVMATKDVYSSRYFDASLALAMATDAGGPSSDGFFLAYANRSRANALKGLFSSLRRAIVERRARGGLEEHLKALKIQLEAGVR